MTTQAGFMLCSSCAFYSWTTVQLCYWNRGTKLISFLLGGCGKLFGNFAVGRVASRRTRISMQIADADFQKQEQVLLLLHGKHKVKRNS